MDDTFEQKKIVSRVEVIDHRKNAEKFGRAFMAWNVGSVAVAIQDEGRTLKVFLADKTEQNAGT